MNLVLSFVHPKKPPRTVGPFTSVRLDGDSVRQDRQGGLVALHRDHLWEIDGERYYRLDATASVRIHFERRAEVRSRSFGPYGRFSAIDGIAYTDDRVFAFVDSKVGDWFCYDDGQHWPVMVVTDATSLRDARLPGLIAVLAPLVPGVIGLWHGARLLYLGSAACLRSRFAALLGEGLEYQGNEVTGVTWEAHDDPAAREAQLVAEYQHGASTLRQTYGRAHGGSVRAERLIARSKAALERSQSMCELTRRLLAPSPA